MDAIRELAKRTGTKRKNFGFAGTKDKFALTTQRVGCFGIKPEKLEKIKNSIKGIKIRDIQKTNVKLRMGSLWGNKFTIRIRLKENADNINIEDKALSFVKGEIKDADDWWWKATVSDDNKKITLELKEEE
jgi:tRNA pseudouridine13 synthase